jgi:hypothetical protein
LPDQSTSNVLVRVRAFAGSTGPDVVEVVASRVVAGGGTVVVLVVVLVDVSGRVVAGGSLVAVGSSAAGVVHPEASRATINRVSARVRMLKGSPAGYFRNLVARLKCRAGA